MKICRKNFDLVPKVFYCKRQGRFWRINCNFFRQGSIDVESFDYKRLKPVWYHEFVCKY